MAETTTITKPAPILEGSLTAFLKSIDKLGAGAVPSTFTGIDTSAYAPKGCSTITSTTRCNSSSDSTCDDRISWTRCIQRIYVSVSTRSY